jgi:hypothetical protein
MHILETLSNSRQTCQYTKPHDARI